MRRVQRGVEAAGRFSTWLSLALDTLPEAHPLALVADARLERQPGARRPGVGLLVQRLVLGQARGVHLTLDRGQRAGRGAERELEQARVAQVGELGGG